MLPARLRRPLQGGAKCSCSWRIAGQYAGVGINERLKVVVVAWADVTDARPFDQKARKISGDQFGITLVIQKN